MALKLAVDIAVTLIINIMHCYTILPVRIMRSPELTGRPPFCVVIRLRWPEIERFCPWDLIPRANPGAVHCWVAAFGYRVPLA